MAAPVTALYIRGMVDPDRCPRCGGPFHCGAQDPEPCPCTSLKLTPAQLADLRRRYTGCLCLRCLRQISLDLSEAPAGEAC
jgi:ribosomal protein L34E